MSGTGSTPQASDATWSPSAVHSRATMARQVVLRSWEKSALTVDQYAKIVVDFAESAEERQRRQLTRRRLDILRDAWGPLLKASFENWTTDPVQDAVLGVGRDHLDLSRNPAKRIWHDCAVLYTAAPTRSTEPPEAGNRYSEILEGTKFNLFWSVVETLLQTCNEVLVWPDVIEVGGRKLVRHRYATGDSFAILVTDRDPNVLECVCIHDEWRDSAGRFHKQWKLWTDDWHAVYEVDPDSKDGELRRADIVEEDAPDNPYGVIPHHLLRRVEWQDITLDATSGEDVVDGTLRGGEGQLFLRYHAKMSGFKQGVLTGLDFEGPQPQQMLDPGAVLRFQGNAVNFSLVDWELDLKSTQDVLDTDELRLAASRGINPEKYKRTASYQTGFGARLSERPLELLRSSMVPIFAEAEAAYYRNACIVWAAHKLDGAPSNDAKFAIKHAPYQFPEDPGQQLDLEAKELSLLQADHVELTQRRRPELTDEKAEELIRKRGERIAEVQKLKVKMNIPADMTKESASAEANGAEGPIVRDGKKPPIPGSQPGKPNSEME